MSEERTNQMVKVDTAQLARMTAGASGGMVLARMTTTAVQTPFGRQTMLGRTVGVTLPLVAAWGILRYGPSNQYTKGAAIGAAMVSVSSILNWTMSAFMGGNGGNGNGGNGSNGQQGLQAAQQRAMPAPRGDGAAGMGAEQTVSLAQK